jgi:hypothetical protein
MADDWIISPYTLFAADPGTAMNVTLLSLQTKERDQRK